MSLDDISEKLNSINDNSILAWALLLMESMKVIINELKVVKDIAARVNVLGSFKAVSEIVTSNLENENSRLLKLITNLELKVDDEEQRSRNTCLLIHGIQENDRENTDELALQVINNDIGLSNIQQCEIQRSHRLGPKFNQKRNLRSSSTNPTKTPIRPILVKFTHYNTSIQIEEGTEREKHIDFSEFNEIQI